MGTTDQLDWNLSSLSFLAPEIILVSGICLLFLMSLLKKIPSWVLPVVSQTCVLVFLAASFASQSPDTVNLMNGMIQKTGVSDVLRIYCGLATFLALSMPGTRTVRVNHAEYDALILAVLLGASLTLMSAHFTMVMLGVELMSLSSYVLTGFRNQRRAAEGSLKYFPLGTTLTAVMIYGMTLVYGVTGTLHFASQEFAERLMHGNASMVLPGACLVTAGFLFKMGVAPFHFWAPDVYEAAPAPVVAFFSVVPKFAGLGIFMKFILSVYLFGQSPIDWPFIVAAISAFTIIVGSLGALRQDHFRRLMAYASIAQSGFLLMGVACFTQGGIQATLFYAAAFLLANFSVFLIMDDLEVSHGITRISDARLGLPGMRNYGVVITIGLASLTGLPPLAGFTGKLLLFTSVYESYGRSSSMILLALLGTALLATALSFYFYFRIPWAMFLRKQSGEVRTENTTPHRANLFGWLLVVILLYLFLNPSLLMGWLNRINFAF